jgi:16S rRNA (cytosine967-C5)-methyltransferase
MAQAGLEARAAAVKLMCAVSEDGALLSAAAPGILAKLEPADRARAQRLATEALRWSQRADRLLGPHLRNRPEDAAMNPLRLALYEINAEGAEPHGPVNAAVALAPKRKAGLVNAVLRNVLRRGTSWNDLPMPMMPKWLRKPSIKAWGKEAVSAMEQVHAGPVPLDLTLRDPNSDLPEALGAEVLLTGSLRLRDYGKVSAMPGYAKGAWWVQDAAAALPAKLLDARPGESVLDLCAAPGGKTMQLASAGAEVTALDISEDRMARVAENLARTSLAAEQIIADATKWEPKRTFDAILLDAPCSGTGTLRRHPDLAHAKDGSGLGELVALQAEMIARAVKWLKPGGRMVYCTCSLLPDEGEEQLKNALSRHPELSFEPPDAPWIEPEWHSSEGGLRIRPDHWAERGGIDGFFIALLKKKS